MSPAHRVSGIYKISSDNLFLHYLIMQRATCVQRVINVIECRQTTTCKTDRHKQRERGCGRKRRGDWMIGIGLLLWNPIWCRHVQPGVQTIKLVVSRNCLLVVAAETTESLWRSVEGFFYSSPEDGLKDFKISLSQPLPPWAKEKKNVVCLSLNHDGCPDKLTSIYIINKVHRRMFCHLENSFVCLSIDRPVYTLVLSPAEDSLLWQVIYQVLYHLGYIWIFNGLPIPRHLIGWYRIRVRTRYAVALWLYLGNATLTTTAGR